MANVEWFGDYAYFKATGVSLTFIPSVAPPGPPYAFNNPNPTIETGPVGQFISSDTNWSEGGGQLDRFLRFGFTPRITDGNDPASDAELNGWSLVSVDARDNDEEDIYWRESFLSWEERPSNVAVDASSKLFSCQSFKVSLKDTGQYGDVIGTFEAKDVLFGAYLLGSYNPSTMNKYNPCDAFNGQECRAEEGVVYCGDTLYNPPAGEDADGAAAPHNLDYYGPNSFLDVIDAHITVGATSNVPEPPNYSFRDKDWKLPVLDSGSFGNRIAREDWDEEHTDENGNTQQVERELRFLFEPTDENIFGDYNEYERVKLSGYRIYKLQLKDAEGNWISWESPSSSSKSMMTVPVKLGYDYFYCDKIEIDMPGGTSYESKFSRIGGYLQDGYSLSKLRPYNPCVELPGYSGSCRATNGVVFCGGSIIDPNALPPTPAPTQGESTPSPTREPTFRQPGVDLEWAGTYAYFMGSNVEATLTTGESYTFEPDSGTGPTVDTSTDGKYLQAGGAGDWTEGGLERSVYFRSYSAAGSGQPASSRPLVLSEMKMRANDGTWIWWTKQSGAFEESMIVVPPNYQAFACDSAVFNFRVQSGAPNIFRGTFTAENFRYGNYLTEGYVPQSLTYFQPCENLPNPEEYGCGAGSDECRCAVVDGQVSCNGIDVFFEDLYPGVSRVAGQSASGVVGARSTSGAGRTATVSGRRRSAGMMTVALLVAEAVHGGILF